MNPFIHRLVLPALMIGLPAAAITWRAEMTDPPPNTDRNTSTPSALLAARGEFNGTGIVSTNVSAGTGVLIAESWVLTARHVVAGAGSGTFFVEGASRTIAQFYLRADSDVALVRLASPLSGTAWPPTPIYMGGDEVGKEVWIAGYGRHGEFTGDPNLLSPAFQGRYAAQNRIMEIFDAGGTIGKTLVFQQDTGLDALEYEGASAPGDSGGPMFMRAQGRWWVVGEAYGVIPGRQGFYYGRVTAYRDWIIQTTGMNFNQVFWDSDPAQPAAQPGDGIWNASNPTWHFQGQNFVWGDGMDVVFPTGTTAYTVTRDLNVRVGGLDFQSADITLAGTGEMVLTDGAVVTTDATTRLLVPLGGNAWQKRGQGDLILTQPNTFDGQLDVQNGRVRISHSQALGDGGATLIRGGAALASLEFAGELMVSEALQLIMHTHVDHRQLVHLQGNTTLSGALSLNAGGGRWDIASLSGEMLFSGDVRSIVPTADIWRTLTLHGPGKGAFTGEMRDAESGSLLNVQIASGDWRLEGVDKTYRGVTTVTGGTLQVDCGIASDIRVQSGAGSRGEGHSSCDVIMEDGSYWSVALTDWDQPPLPFRPRHLFKETNATLSIRIESEGLQEFQETEKRIPLIWPSEGFGGFPADAIEVEHPHFPGKGDWSVEQDGQGVWIRYLPDLYEAWRARYDWQDRDDTPFGDADGDGRVNLLEYAVDRNPLFADAGSELIVEQHEGLLKLKFTWVPDPKLLYELYRVADPATPLAEWQVLWSSEGQAPHNGVQWVTPPASEKGFYHLRVRRTD